MSCNLCYLVPIRNPVLLKPVLCHSAGVQAEAGEGDPGEEGAEVPHPESPRPLPPT